VTLQSSASAIAEGLNLWWATSIKHSSTAGTPWKSTKETYLTIDSIQTGSLPFKTFNFYYTRPKPPMPPPWMEWAYELNACDVLAVVRKQLATADFSKKFDYVPYKEFNGKGKHLWSNIMSGHCQWVFMQAVCVFPCFSWLISHFILGHALARSMQSQGNVRPYHCGKQ
jgi:hypothetical protein